MLHRERSAQPVHHGHGARQAERLDECRHQGCHPDELQAGRGALGRQNPAQEVHDHRVSLIS